MKDQELSLVQSAPMPVEVARKQHTAIDILQAAIEKGITSENVAVVKEIRQMVLEEQAAAAKIAFNRDFFELRQEIAKMNIYADKAAKTDNGAIAYTYCSESELAAKLEPVLIRHNFSMLFGQRHENDRTVAIITLIHREGHEENREYSVRSGSTNRMKDATAADTGATTSAWRHLVIKMFGMKSRIQEIGDARNLGEHITDEQVEILSRMLKEKNRDEKKFLEYAQAKSFKEIMSSRYDDCYQMLLKARAL